MAFLWRYRWSQMLVCFFWLAGCSSQPEKVAIDENIEPEVEKVAPLPRGKVDVSGLLWSAERSLADDRLITPEHDNAYDRFRAVLLLEPGNAKAEAGIQQIVVRYMQLARDAASRNDYDLAKQRIAKAQLILPDNAALTDLYEEFAHQQAAHRTQFKQDGSLVLSREDMRLRDDGVVRRIKALTQQMSESGETMLIVARTDEEGRWIYKQMRKAIPSFRPRGDIKLGSPTRIVLQPPI